MKTLTAILLLMFLTLQYQLWIGEGGLPEVWQLQQEVEKQQQENIELRERNARLAAQVRDLKQGLEAVEEVARDELGMVKQGETFYQIIKSPEKRDATQANESD